MAALSRSPCIGLVIARDEHRATVAQRVRDAGFSAHVFDATRSPVSAECAGWIVSDGSWGAAAKVVAVLRDLKVAVPIVAIVATIEGMVQARRAGANDCVLLPLDVEELCVRLRLLVSEGRPPASSRREVWLQDGIVLDMTEIRHGAGRIVVRRTEAAVLRYLAARRPRVVSSRELLTQVLKSEGDGGAVRQHVWEIRRKLRAAGLPDVVRTVRGVGYGMLEAPRRSGGRPVAASVEDPD